MYSVYSVDLSAVGNMLKVLIMKQVLVFHSPKTGSQVNHPGCICVPFIECIY